MALFARIPTRRGFSTSSLQATPRAIAEKLIKENNIMVFSKTYCPFCQKAKSALDDLKLKYGLLELDNEKDGTAIQQALQEICGQRTVPNIFVKGKHIGGCDATLALIAKGEFQKLAL